jgi:hypothetical protein
MTKSKIRLSKINVPRLRYTTKSDPISKLKKPGSPMSRREEHSGNPGVRISAGRQHIASRSSVKQDFAQFCKILLNFEPALSAVERVKENFHQIVRNLLSDCLGSARASRADFGASAEIDFATRQGAENLRKRVDRAAPPPRQSGRFGL